MTALQDPSWFGSWERSPPDVLWSSGDYLYCRLSRDAADGAQRELIAVVPSAEHPTTSNVNRLEHEFALKDYLDSSWALRPIDLVRERGRTILVLENVEAKPFDQVAGAPLDLELFLRLAIAASNAVVQLHASRLVHKDITARNILVDNTNGEVRLTGFGIASRLERERQSLTLRNNRRFAGLHGAGADREDDRSVDSRSDLYSLGVTFYQVLTGALPFTATDPMEWVHCHLARQPVAPAERRKESPAQSRRSS